MQPPPPSTHTLQVVEVDVTSYTPQIRSITYTIHCLSILKISSNKLLVCLSLLQYIVAYQAHPIFVFKLVYKFVYVCSLSCFQMLALILSQGEVECYGLKGWSVVLVELGRWFCWRPHFPGTRQYKNCYFM